MIEEGLEVRERGGGGGSEYGSQFERGLLGECVKQREGGREREREVTEKAC